MSLKSSNSSKIIFQPNKNHKKWLFRHYYLQWSHTQAVWPEKIAKCLYKLPKNDFTWKMIEFDTFTKIALLCVRFGQINCCTMALKTWPKFNKNPNLVTLYTRHNIKIGVVLHNLSMNRVSTWLNPPN